MKKVLLLALICSAWTACTPKKTEDTSKVDSVAVDSVIRADVPAPASLAFSEMSGFTARNTVALQDTVNFILLTSQEEFDKNFTAEKNSGNEVAKPDFIINYIIGVVCLPTQLTTTITVDKSEVQGEEINVYISIQQGEKQSSASKPSRVFALERRDGIASIQFFINSKKGKSFFMTGL